MAAMPRVLPFNARTQLTGNTEQSEAPQRIDWSTAVTC